MLFNSYFFIFCFLPICLIGYFGINKIFKSKNPSLIWLIGCSLFFYGYFNWSYLLILLCSISVNWSAVLIMRKTQGSKKKLLEVCGIVFNVGLIFYFKYYDFFITNFNKVFYTEFNLKHLVLPLGISFFTFQQISFIVDSYRNETSDYTIIEYVLYVSFFPQLIAGPIVLQNELVPQFRCKEKRKVNWKYISRGCYLFVIGLFKKVLVADTFGIAVDWGYQHADLLSSVDAWIIMLSYTFQIYFDFSGYCDMASGIAAMFNIDLPINFDSPYKAFSITEFWKRWHITLTRFLRKYIYFPLGGSKKGKVRTYINMMIVFLVSGIWHGANWTFVVWGMLHGTAQVINRIFKEKWEKLHLVTQWGLTFIFVNFAWVFFRAESIAQAIKIIWRGINLRQLSISSELVDCFSIVEIKGVRWILQQTSVWNNFYNSYWINGFIVWLWIGGALYVVLNKENAQKITPTYDVKHAIGLAFIFVWVIVSLSGVSTFLYFNF